MPDDQPGQSPSGGNPPAPTEKTADQRFAELEDRQKKTDAILQSTSEELKRVNNLNGVLMQKLSSGGQPPENGGGMNVERTTPFKFKRDFANMDPTTDPKGYAESLILETAEQVSAVVARGQESHANAQSLRNQFYVANKDLVGYEIEVGHFSQLVQGENPGLSFAEAAKLVATRTREYLTSKGLTSQADPSNPVQHVLAPSNGGEGGGKVPIKPPNGDPKEPFNPEKEYANDMKDYSEMRNKERARDGMKTGKV